VYNSRLSREVLLDVVRVVVVVVATTADKPSDAQVSACAVPDGRHARNNRTLGIANSALTILSKVYVFIYLCMIVADYCAVCFFLIFSGRFGTQKAEERRPKDYGS
jgi:hypothetical protein